jgi:hypothetical protein
MINGINPPASLGTIESRARIVQKPNFNEYCSNGPATGIGHGAMQQFIIMCVAGPLFSGSSSHGQQQDPATTAGAAATVVAVLLAKIMTTGPSRRSS